MSHRDDDAIEGIGSRSGSAAGRMSPGMDAWQRYLDAQDEAAASAAEEEALAQQAIERQARQGGVQGAAAPGRADGIGAISAAGAAMAGAASAIDSRADDRSSIMQAMQAEALARMEFADHADNVVAAVRSSGGLDENARLERTDEHREKAIDGALTDRDQQRGESRLVDAPDYVERAERHEQRDAQQRLQDLHHQTRAGASGRAELDSEGALREPERGGEAGA